MSTLKINTLSNLAGSQSTPVENAINGSAKAWVNFNGTGTVAIRAQYNVSSITDSGTGTYRVNLTNAMPDTNYSIVATIKPATDLVGSVWIPGPDGTYGGVTSSSFPVRCAEQTPTLIDPETVCVSIFR
jgi:hypothetical protein